VKDVNYFKAVCCYSKASIEYKIQELNIKFKLESPTEFDELVDCTLCSAFCYIQMREFDQAQHQLTSVLKVESACSEALFLLCWLLTANLKQRLTNKNISDGDITASAERQKELTSAQNAEDLEIAQECITTLRRNAFQQMADKSDAIKLELVDRRISMNSLSTTFSTECVSIRQATHDRCLTNTPLASSDSSPRSNSSQRQCATQESVKMGTSDRINTSA